MKRRLLGHFTPSELRRYLALKSGIFWTLIVVCYLVYPSQNKWWIGSHTFSFLGSFDEHRNPGWWWIFTIAMLFWAASLVPLTFYFYRRFALVSRAGAATGAFFFLLGAAGIALVALFPDVSAPLYGDTRWTDIHEIAAVMTGAGFVFGIFWFALLLLKDRFIPSSRPSPFRHQKLVAPYALWVGVVGVAAWFQITWDALYGEMKANAAASGQDIGSSWAESLNTRYAFPLWENIVIYALFIFLVWFALALAEEQPQREPGEGVV